MATRLGTNSVDVVLPTQVGRDYYNIYSNLRGRRHHAAFNPIGHAREFYSRAPAVFLVYGDRSIALLVRSPSKDVVERNIARLICRLKFVV